MLLRIVKRLGKHFRTYLNAGCQQLDTLFPNWQKTEEQEKKWVQKSFNSFKYTCGYPWFVLTDSLKLTRVYCQRWQKKRSGKSFYEIRRSECDNVRNPHRSCGNCELCAFFWVTKKPNITNFSWTFPKFHTFLCWLCTLTTPICYGCFSSLPVIYLWVFKKI